MGRGRGVWGKVKEGVGWVGDVGRLGRLAPCDVDWGAGVEGSGVSWVGGEKDALIGEGTL